jgi:lysine-N-methylase
MLQTLFPFGRSGSLQFSAKSIFQEYLQLASRFAWINGLLIGAAGNHKDGFAEEHIVKVIQSFTRDFEHYPICLDGMNDYIHSHGLDNLEGMAILLRS